MAVTLLRHGALEKKLQKRYIGHSDIILDENLFEEEKIEFLKKQSFDEIYSSDLLRCTQTLDKMGFTYKKDIRLREVKFKDKFELKNFDEVSKLPCFKQKYLKSQESWHEYICEESFLDFTKRIVAFINSLDLNKNILICSHGGALKILSQYLKKEECFIKNINFEYLDTEVINIS